MEPTKEKELKTLAGLGLAKNNFMNFVQTIDWNLLPQPEINGLREITYRLKNVHNLMENRVKSAIAGNEAATLQLEELYQLLDQAAQLCKIIPQNYTELKTLKTSCNSVAVDLEQCKRQVLNASKLVAKKSMELKGGNNG